MSSRQASSAVSEGYTVAYKFNLLAGVACAAVLAPGAAFADPATDAKIAALEAQVKALSAAIAELKADAAAKPAPAPVATASAAPATLPAKPAAEAKPTQVAIAAGRPTITSGDGAFTASLRGVVQLDAAIYDQRSAGPLSTDFRRGSLGDAAENDRARDLGDGTNFRRARIGIEGKAFGDFQYNLLYDFGGSGNEDVGKIINAWMQYDGLGPVKLRVGAFAPPSNLDDATSANSTLFIERAAGPELVRGIAGGDGRAAAALLSNGERWNLSLAVSGNPVNTQTFDEQLAFVGRAAFLPVKTDSTLVHLGVNTTLVVDPAATGPKVAGAVATPIRLRDRPELRVDGTRLVDTGAIDANGLTAIGGEFAVQYKAFSVQAEYFDIKIDRKGPLSDPSFNGWHVQGAWTLTGEPRRYSMASAGFDVPRPARNFDPKTGRWGAWEIAARYSDLDLNYRAGAAGTAPTADAIRGGEQKILSLGLNWYPNAVVRFQADFQDVSIRRLSPGGAAFGAGAGATPPAGAQIGQDFRVYSLRSQYAF